MSSETSGPLSPISEALFFTRERHWGLFLEVREQNPQVSLGYLPRFSPCSELYSSRAFHAPVRIHWSPGESTSTVYWVHRSLGLWDGSLVLSQHPEGTRMG